VAAADLIFPSVSLLLLPNYVLGRRRGGPLPISDQQQPIAAIPGWKILNVLSNKFNEYILVLIGWSGYILLKKMKTRK
jgi:hypothetical protein